MEKQHTKPDIILYTSGPWKMGALEKFKTAKTVKSKLKKYVGKIKKDFKEMGKNGLDTYLLSNILKRLYIGKLEVEEVEKQANNLLRNICRIFLKLPKTK